VAITTVAASLNLQKASTATLDTLAPGVVRRGLRRTMETLLGQLPYSQPLPPPHRSPWLLPGVMVGLTIVCLVAAEAWVHWSRLLYIIPYTFLGNSLAPLPYDGAVVYLGGRYSLPLIVITAVAATAVIEAWNMELLARLLAREGTRGFRNHRVTQLALAWYRKAPFWSLVATCIIPIVPHYPMRFLVVLAGYSQWKYQLSVVLGRGARYAGLASVGVFLPIPPLWIVAASLVALALGLRGARKLNQPPPELKPAAAEPALRGGRSVAVEEA
jgi:membrane protein YqaA with SNARE-associated domain